MSPMKPITLYLLCVVLSAGALTGIPSSSKMTTNQTQIRYFDRFHNDNVYLYSFKNEFEFAMEPNEVETSDKYYKVYYGPDGKYYKAELFKNGEVKETYSFDSHERVIRSTQRNVVHVRSYGENETILLIIEGTRLSEYWVCSYEGDKLIKVTKYIPSDVILEYTVYDHENWGYKTYDITGDLLDEGRMVRPGK